MANPRSTPSGQSRCREYDLEQHFALFTEGRKPKIYKLPVNQTARLINEFPGRKVEVFETLDSARKAALAIIESALIASKTAPGDKELLKTLSELTEDRIERYLFY